MNKKKKKKINTKIENTNKSRHNICKNKKKKY